MSERAIAFVEEWVAHNVHAEGSDRHDLQAAACAAQCRTAAIEEGIPDSEIGESFDDLTAFMAGEIEEANDERAREAARLAAEND